MKLELFNNAELNVALQTVMINEEIYFVAKGLAEALDYAKVDKMYKKIDDEDKVYASQVLDNESILQNGGMNNRTILVNESGIYTAIFGSKKSEAKKFRQWVTSEVLPALRKDGVYITDNKIEEATKELVKSLSSKKANHTKPKMDAIFDIYENEKVVEAVGAVLRAVAKSTGDKEHIYMSLRSYMKNRRNANAIKLVQNINILNAYTVAYTDILKAHSKFRQHTLTRSKNLNKSLEAGNTELRSSIESLEKQLDAAKETMTNDVEIANLQKKYDDAKEKLVSVKEENATLKEFDPRDVKFFIESANVEKELDTITRRLIKAGKEIVFAETMEFNDARGKGSDKGRNNFPHQSGLYLNKAGKTIECGMWVHADYKYVKLSTIGLQGGYATIVSMDLHNDESNVGHFIGANRSYDFFGTYEALSDILVIYKEKN